jgi:pyruvate/2-oxoglutarate dehydrogenase complex dihydrolipoamide acyltransferase (E2) component
VLGVIEEIRVAPGDRVSEGSVVLVVDTHKAALDVRSPADGTVIEILVSVGEEIQERKPVATCKP